MSWQELDSIEVWDDAQSRGVKPFLEIRSWYELRSRDCSVNKKHVTYWLHSNKHFINVPEYLWVVSPVPGLGQIEEQNYPWQESYTEQAIIKSLSHLRDRHKHFL